MILYFCALLSPRLESSNWLMYSVAVSKINSGDSDSNTSANSDPKSIRNY